MQSRLEKIDRLLKLIQNNYNHTKTFVNENRYQICDLHCNEQFREILEDAERLFTSVSFNTASVFHDSCCYEVKDERQPLPNEGGSLNSTVNFAAGKI